MRIFRLLPAIPFPVPNIMKILKYSPRPKRNSVWQVLPSPTQWEHRYEVLDHEIGNALKRCLHCASLEAK